MQLTDQIYLNRYAALYNLAKTIPNDERFNLAFWSMQNTQSECGTSACLAGHAALHPFFVAQGFKTGPLPFGHAYFRGEAARVATFEPASKTELKDAIGLYLPHTNEFSGYDANIGWLAVFWGMRGTQLMDGYDRDEDNPSDQPNEMLHPFWPGSYDSSPTAKEAARYLRRWMQEWWPKAAIVAAIQAHRHVQYNAQFVHYYTDWTPPVTKEAAAAWRKAVVQKKTALSCEEWAAARDAVRHFTEML